MHNWQLLTIDNKGRVYSMFSDLVELLLMRSGITGEIQLEKYVPYHSDTRLAD